MRIKNLFVILLPMISIGCYTQLATLDYSPPQQEVITEVDSTGDTVKIIREVDTIVSREKETCVWVRDYTGYPRLKCYSTYYPRAWITYSNTPWWYRNDPFWHDYDYCPRYYYYDPSCGCCRYIDNYRYPYRRGSYKGGGKSSSGGSSSYTPRSSRSKGVPGSGSAIPSSGSSQTTGQLNKSLNDNTQKQGIQTPVRSGRSAGVPDPGTARPVDTQKSETRTGSVPLNTGESIRPEQEQKSSTPVRRGRSAGVPDPRDVKQ